MLDSNDKPRSPEDYDQFVSAEIPDEATQPLLYETVSKNMMHGPCGVGYPNAPCMEDGKCKKDFPKAFSDETYRKENGYPLYRRRDNGRTVERYRGIVLDNTWVVTFNPLLSQK